MGDAPKFADSFYEGTECLPIEGEACSGAVASADIPSDNEVGTRALVIFARTNAFVMNCRVVDLRDGHRPQEPIDVPARILSVPTPQQRQEYQQLWGADYPASCADAGNEAPPLFNPMDGGPP